MEELKKLEEQIKDNKDLFKKLDEGSKNVLYCYYNYIRIEKYNELRTKKLFLEDVVWEKDYKSTLEAFKKFGIKEFIFGSTWSSALNFLNYLIDNGCSIEGNELYKEEERYGTEPEEYKGLVIKIN